MSTPNDNLPERRHIDNIPQGTPVICNGYNGAIVRQYDGDTYEIRLASGVVATDDFEIDQSATQPQPQQGEQDTVSEVTPAVWQVIENAMNRAADYRVERDALQAQRDDLQARVSGLEGQLAIAEQSKVELLAALESVISFATVYVARHDSTPHNRAKIAAARAAIARATEANQ